MEIIKGVIPTAKKVIIYGPEGIGKSTLASQFPDPVFSDTEGSTNAMNIARFSKATSWSMLKDQVTYLKNNPNTCKTFVIDTIDWAEQMCVQSICDKHGKTGIEDFGYGNGYVYVREEFGRFLNMLSELIDKGINVVLTAHAQMRKFEQPDELGAYDRWELKLGKKTSSQTSPLVKEWADMVLFCNYKTLVVNVDGQGAQKGKNKVQGGRRVMYTSHHPCWDAKNRYGLPEECPMEYSSIAHIFNEQPAPAATVAENTTAAPATKPEPVQHNGPDVRKFMEAEVYPEAVPFQESKTEEPKQEEEKTVQPDEPVNEISRFFSDPNKLPKALVDLMNSNDVSEWEIQAAVTSRGYYPEGTLIENYMPEFINGVIIAAWPQMFEVIKQIKTKECVEF